MTIFKKKCILKIVLSGVTILSQNRLDADIRKRLTTNSYGAYADVSNERLAELVFPDKSSGAVDSRAFAELQSRFADMMLSKLAGTKYSGTDVYDLMQECSLGLLDAARDYDPGKGASFATFASTCVGNRICDALRSASARKNSPLKSIDEISEKETSKLTDPMPGPESRFIVEESVGELTSRITQRLTSVENAVFFDYFNGFSYGQISVRQGISVKAVDNALQRARRKLKSMLSEPDDQKNDDTDGKDGKGGNTGGKRGGKRAVKGGKDVMGGADGKTGSGAKDGADSGEDDQ